MIITVPTALAGLMLCLTTGVWCGYRYALASRRLDAVLDHTLSRLDAEREYDELRAWQKAEADKWLSWDHYAPPGDQACGPPPWQGHHR